MKRKEYQELTIEERVAKEKKKTKIVFIVVIMGILAIIGFFWIFGDAVLDAMIPETPVYELSEEEKKWLKDIFMEDQESIEQGYLLSYQAKELEKGRYGLLILNEKYPGYQFHITHLDVFTDSDFSVKENKTGEYFSMCVYENEDGSFEVYDDYYCYFMNEKYASYLEGQLKDKIEKLAIVYVNFRLVKGKDYDINMTPDDIVSGRLKAYPRVFMHLTANKMTNEECIEYSKNIKKITNDMNLWGHYTILFWNLTEEKIELPIESGSPIYEEDFSVTREEDNG